MSHFHATALWIVLSLFSFFYSFYWYEHQHKEQKGSDDYWARVTFLRCIFGVIVSFHPEYSFPHIIQLATLFAAVQLCIKRYPGYGLGILGANILVIYLRIKVFAVAFT